MNDLSKVLIPVIITFSIGNTYLKNEETELHSEQIVYADNLGAKLSQVYVTGSTHTIMVNKRT
jgi:hypothetical protein